MADNSLKKGRYTKYGNKIGLHSDSKHVFINQDNDVVLNFPFKDSVLEGGMTKEEVGREERFLHTELDRADIDTLEDPKVLTNFRLIDNDGDRKLDEKSNIEFFDEDGDLKQNLLIKGNNLLALNVLKEKLTDSVKLIYIDPPYNTGSDGFRYNDRFNHTAWLVFMKNRLEIARDLLRTDGTIYISLDDSESHYGKVLADEIFGRENFLGNICYQRSGAAGLGQGGKFVVNTAEAILAYAKNKEFFEAYDLEDGVPLEVKHMKRYNGVLTDPGQRTLIEELHAKSNGEIIKIYKHTNYKVDTISLAGFEERKEVILQEYVANFEKIFRLNIPQIENQFQHSLIQKMSDGELYSVDYIASRGKHKDMLVTNHYYKKQLLAWLKSSAILKDNEIQKTNKLTDFWAHADIPKADLANEGGVTLARGKKPEQLLKRIIGMSTLPGDLVLDYHLGSGTTAAVAHKMGRRWVGIEQMDYIEELALKRLENVIKGDQTGVSKSVQWQGGGSFIYLELKKYNQEFIDRINDSKSMGDLDVVYSEMSKNAFLKFWFDKKEFEKEENFRALSLEDRKKKLIDILDDNQLYLNYPEMEDSRHNVSLAEKNLTDRFYGKTK